MELNQLKRYTDNMSGKRLGKRLICISPEKNIQFLDLNKKKIVTELLTGHC